MLAGATALALACPEPAAARSGPESGSMTITVRIPDVVRDLRGQLVMTVRASGPVTVLDARPGSPGWSEAVYVSDGTTTVTVLG